MTNVRAWVKAFDDLGVDMNEDLFDERIPSLGKNKEYSNISFNYISFLLYIEFYFFRIHKESKNKALKNEGED